MKNNNHPFQNKCLVGIALLLFLLSPGSIKAQFESIIYPTPCSIAGNECGVVRLWNNPAGKEAITILDCYRNLNNLARIDGAGNVRKLDYTIDKFVLQDICVVDDRVYFCGCDRSDVNQSSATSYEGYWGCTKAAAIDLGTSTLTHRDRANNIIYNHILAYSIGNPNEDHVVILGRNPHTDICYVKELDYNYVANAVVTSDTRQIPSTRSVWDMLETPTHVVFAGVANSDLVLNRCDKANVIMSGGLDNCYIYSTPSEIETDALHIRMTMMDKKQFALAINTIDAVGDYHVNMRVFDEASMKMTDNQYLNIRENKAYIRGLVYLETKKQLLVGLNHAMNTSFTGTNNELVVFTPFVRLTYAGTVLYDALYGSPMGSLCLMEPDFALSFGTDAWFFKDFTRGYPSTSCYSTTRQTIYNNALAPHTIVTDPSFYYLIPDTRRPESVIPNQVTVLPYCYNR